MEFFRGYFKVTEIICWEGLCGGTRGGYCAREISGGPLGRGKSIRYFSMSMQEILDWDCKGLDLATIAKRIVNRCRQVSIFAALMTEIFFVIGVFPITPFIVAP